MSESENIIVLNGQDGTQTRFEFLDLIEYRGKNYVVLLPVDDEDDDGNVVILQVDEETDSDEESYLEVEDDSIVQAVFRIFKEKNKDSYDFTDSDSAGAAKSSGKKMKCRSRFALLLISWVGAWAGLHLNFLGYREAASNYRRHLGGIFALINPVAWIMHVVEIFKVMFGGYREDAYGRPVRYLSFLHKTK